MEGVSAARTASLMVRAWRVLQQWIEQFRGLFDPAAAGGGALWPSETACRCTACATPISRT